MAWKGSGVRFPSAPLCDVARHRGQTGPFDVAVQAAVDDDAITKDEARRYLDSLVELETRGAFLFAGLAVSVVATA